MLSSYIEKLVAVGFTEKQAKVYLSLLNLGPSGIEQIVKATSINKSTVYVQIQDLIQIGLISSVRNGKQNTFMAESPMNITRVLEKQQEKINENKIVVSSSIVPDLLKVYSSTGVRPIIRTFEGKEGLITMRNEILESGEKELLAAFCFDYLYKMFTVDELMAFSNLRSKNQIKSFILYNKTGDDAPLVPPQEMKRLPIEKFPFSSDIYIYGNNVAVASMQGEVMGIIITNQQITESFRSMFWLAWNGQNQFLD